MTKFNIFVERKILKKILDNEIWLLDGWQGMTVKQIRQMVSAEQDVEMTETSIRNNMSRLEEDGVVVTKMVRNRTHYRPGRKIKNQIKVLELEIDHITTMRKKALDEATGWD